MKKTIVLLLSLVAVGCNGRTPASPAQPTPTQPPPATMPPTRASRGEDFEVTGIVTDQAGRPLPGITVGMRHWLGGFVSNPTVVTDAAGAYRIAFTADPWTQGSLGRAAAQAELVGGGYEWHKRVVLVGALPIVENFRLRPALRMKSGESLVLPIGPDDSACMYGLSWTWATVCRTVHVDAPGIGNVTVEAISEDGSSQPLLSACCQSGDDRIDNPVTLPATPGTETTIEVGLLERPTTTQRLVVKASFDP